MLTSTQPTPAPERRVPRPPADAPDEIQFKAIDLELTRLELKVAEWEPEKRHRFLETLFGPAKSDTRHGRKAGAA